MRTRGTSTVLLAIRLFVGLAVICLAGCSPEEPSVTSAQTAAPALSPGVVDDERILNALENEPGSWLAHGMDFNERRFSPLTQYGQLSSRRTSEKRGLSVVGAGTQPRKLPKVSHSMMEGGATWEPFTPVAARDSAMGRDEARPEPAEPGRTDRPPAPAVARAETAS